MLVVISGPSGAGKSTFVKALLEADSRLSFSVSTTTRPPRRGETEGIQYSFVSEEEFDRLVAAESFIEWAHVHGHRYGTRRAHVEQMLVRGLVPLLDVDVQGGVRVIELFGPEAVSVFIFPPTWHVLEERLRARATDSEDSLRTRLENARWEIGFAERYEYFIVNDALDAAIGQMRAIITAERCRRVRVGRMPLAEG
jgi:guanylate kinase